MYFRLWPRRSHRTTCPAVMTCHHVIACHHVMTCRHVMTCHHGMFFFCRIHPYINFRFLPWGSALGPSVISCFYFIVVHVHMFFALPVLNLYRALPLQNLFLSWIKKSSKSHPRLIFKSHQKVINKSSTSHQQVINKKSSKSHQKVITKSSKSHQKS